MLNNDRKCRKRYEKIRAVSGSQGLKCKKAKISGNWRWQL